MAPAYEPLIVRGFKCCSRTSNKNSSSSLRKYFSRDDPLKAILVRASITGYSPLFFPYLVSTPIVAIIILAGTPYIFSARAKVAA